MVHSMLHRCSWCLDAFDFAMSGAQAITLACGHSFCRKCLLSADLKCCYVCHKPFTGSVDVMAFDYYIRDTMDSIAAPDPLLDILMRLGVEDGEIKMLPEDALVLGEIISSTGMSGVVRRGTLLGVQASCKCCWLRKRRFEIRLETQQACVAHLPDAVHRHVEHKWVSRKVVKHEMYVVTMSFHVCKDRHVAHIFPAVWMSCWVTGAWRTSISHLAQASCQLGLRKGKVYVHKPANTNLCTAINHVRACCWMVSTGGNKIQLQVQAQQIKLPCLSCGCCNHLWSLHVCEKISQTAWCMTQQTKQNIASFFRNMCRLQSRRYSFFPLVPVHWVPTISCFEKCLASWAMKLSAMRSCSS